MLKYCVAILTAVFAAVNSDGDCNVDNVLRCVQSYVPPSLQFLEDAFPDAAFLDENCGPAISTLECINSNIEKCPSFAAFMGTDLAVLTGTLDLLHSVCDADSELKKGYLENIDCYNSAIPKMDKCEQDIGLIVSNFFDSIENDTDAEENINRYCLSMEKIFACAIAESVIECGKEETDPLKTMLEGLGSLFIQAACPEEELRDLQVRFALYLLENEIPEFKKKK